MPVLSAPSRGLRLILLVGSAAIAGSCDKGGDVVGPPDAAPVATVEVTPSPISLAVGQAMQLTAIVKAADGSVLTDRTVAWVSSDPAVAGVGESGMVTGASAGAATVTATSEGQSGSTIVTVTVTSAPVASVEVVPSPASVLLEQTAQLTAVLRAENGDELLGRVVAWTSSDEAVATVSETGLVRGVAVGQATITATSEGQSGTTSLTVSAVPVASVEVTPPSAEIDVSGSVQLTATAKDAGGVVLPGRPAIWTTSAANVARVNPTGRVTGIGTGSATITATIEGKTASATVTVSRQPVASVEVEPSPATIVVGRTSQLTATVRAADGAELSGRPVTWTTSDESVAQVGSAGLVTAVAAGTATITATSEGVSGTATVVVTPVGGVIRTWRGGAAGSPSDWSVAGNWNPTGEPIALDSVRVPAAANSAVLSEDVQIAQLLIGGGKVRLGGHRLRVSGLQLPALISVTE